MASFPEGAPMLQNPLLAVSKRQQSLAARCSRPGSPGPQGLRPAAFAKQVSTVALGFQVFSQPAPPHLIAFQAAKPGPTPSAPARRATSVRPAAASKTSHGPCPSLGQPLHSPGPNHILLAPPTPQTRLCPTFLKHAGHGPVPSQTADPFSPRLPETGPSPATGEDNQREVEWDPLSNSQS